MPGCRRQLTRIEDRAQALRPQTIGGTAPPVPALPPQVHERGRVAIYLGHAHAARKVVRPVALWNVARRARLRAAARETLIEEQERAELDRVRHSRNSIGRISCH